MGFLSSALGIAAPIVGGIFGGPAGAAIGGAIGGSILQDDQQNKATGAVIDASKDQIRLQEEALAKMEATQKPFLQAGQSALGPLLASLGIRTASNFAKPLGRPGFVNGSQFTANNTIGQPQNNFDSQSSDIFSQIRGKAGNTGNFNLNRTQVNKFMDAVNRGDGGLTLEEVNPLINAAIEEDTRNIQNSAAARGKLGADGTVEALEKSRANTIARILPQLQQNRLSNLFQAGNLDVGLQEGEFTTDEGQRIQGINELLSVLNSSQNLGNTAESRGQNNFNRLFNVVTGLGQNTAVQQAAQQQNATNNQINSIGQIGQTRADKFTNRGNAIGNLFNQGISVLGGGMQGGPQTFSSLLK